MSNDINDRLKEINIEDFIWIIYLGIIALSFYSNNLERKYFIYKNEIDKEKYKNIIILIFSILVFVYLYFSSIIWFLLYFFLKDSINSSKSLKETDTQEKKYLTYLSFLASLLIAVSGFIFLYIALKDKNLDVELAFN